LDGESEKQTHLCRTIEIKMPTIANEKILFEVKFIQIYIYIYVDGALLYSYGLSIQQHMQPFIYRIQCKIREPSLITGNKFTYLSLEDLKLYPNLKLL
jgi:hypothetical protein